MSGMTLYSWLSRFSFLNYRAKILVMAFVGTHIPLIALASYFALQSAPDWETFVTTVGVTLAATLGGTALTLLVLHALLRPVLRTSEALRAYRETRTLSTLPTHFRDEVGTLMADAADTIAHLDAVRDALEHVDAGTGLMNRKRLQARLVIETDRGRPFALAAIRIANLSRITEAFDAAEADRSVRILADRLRKAMPPEAELARIGEDAFALLLPNRDAMEAGDSAAAALAACGTEIALTALDIRPELLCGIAAFPADAPDATTLLDHAVAAAAKATLVAPTAFHSAAARARSVERLKMEQALRHALERDEFRLHYQPVVDLRSSSVVGAEALIRWQHPELGMVPPGRFIPTAEETGFIDEMGLWVMRQACAQIRSWNEDGRAGLKVAINLSARQFLDPALKDHVAEAIAAARIDPSQLEFELTETAAMADFDYTHRVFTALRDLGVSIAIDDFGTGYASMSALRRLPFDRLKIDREFVTDVYRKRDAQAICGALVTLSRGLGLSVLAEGTETEEEVRFLAGLGCHLFQGFFFAKPAAAPEFGTAVDLIALTAMKRKMEASDAAGALALAG